jgi:hypothetical protein
MLLSGGGFLPHMALIVSAGFATKVTIRRYRWTALDARRKARDHESTTQRRTLIVIANQI